MNLTIKPIKPMNSWKYNKPSSSQVPLIIYTGGGNDPLQTILTSSPGLRLTPTEVVNFSEPMVANVTFVAECRVSNGQAMKARIFMSNQGPHGMLDPEVVLTTSGQYEMRTHMSSFYLDPGPNEIYMEVYVTGGTGYVRYRFFTMIFSGI